MSDSVLAADCRKQGVILCADDFGMSEAVDNGILQLAHDGQLQAASCLVQGPLFSRNASRLLSTSVQCGLHLNFTETFSSACIVMPLRRLILACWTRRLPATRVRRSVIEQLDTFENVMGRRPDFIDGHQHVHQFPVIREILLHELVRRYSSGSRPWLRCTLPPGLSGVPMGMRAKAHVIAVLGGHAFRRQASRAGFDTNRRFLGVYDFRGGESAYASLLQGWLALAQPGDLIMCHPAATIDPGDPLGEQRHAEFTVLAGL